MSVRFYCSSLLCFLLSGYVYAGDEAANSSIRNLYNELIAESGLQFAMPEDFTDIAPQKNDELHYERAILHKTGNLELRFVIRPLGRIQIEYNDPHNASPEPNHLFPLLFESLSTQLSVGGNAYSKPYPLDQTLELFHAEMASASVFDLSEGFSDEFKQALMVGMHKNEHADAYTIFLFNDYAKVKELIQATLTTMTFIP